MPQKKAKLGKAAERIAEILGQHLKSLSMAEAKAMRKEIHNLAVKSSRSASRGKASQSRKSAGPRPLSRTSAKSA
jgi:hypothetical protein